MKLIIPVLLGATLGAVTPGSAVLWPLRYGSLGRTKEHLPPSKSLDHLFKSCWEHALHTSPELATIVGDSRCNHRLSDVSLGSIQKELAWKRAFLTKLKAVPQKDLGAGQLLSRDVLITLIQDQLDGTQFKPWETPLTEMDGLHIDFPQLFSSHP